MRWFRTWILHPKRPTMSWKPLFHRSLTRSDGCTEGHFVGWKLRPFHGLKHCQGLLPLAALLTCTDGGTKTWEALKDFKTKLKTQVKNWEDTQLILSLYSYYIYILLVTIIYIVIISIIVISITSYYIVIILYSYTVTGGCYRCYLPGILVAWDLYGWYSKGTKIHCLRWQVPTSSHFQ